MLLVLKLKQQLIEINLVKWLVDYTIAEKLIKVFLFTSDITVYRIEN